MTKEYTYRGYLIERIEHPKLSTYFAVFSNTGKHIWNHESLGKAKKHIDSLIQRDTPPAPIR